jgi:uncharacterized protein
MAHPLEQTIRDAYAAFGRGDLDGYLSACTSDFIFNIPGKNFMGGKFRGKDGFYELAGRVMQVTGLSFEEKIEDVFANDKRAVVLALHVFQRGGEVKRYQTAHVYSIRDGKLAECWEQPRDQAIFDDAWGPPNVVSMRRPAPASHTAS